ncbi:MAG: translocation/assembly module TamB domain-containing protein [Rhodobacteraceae bacterium]|nr:translocation/assembly module TamB domain-containing protein [Paracoccaceae bacterium]
MLAQDSDRGFVTGFLEDSLSGFGRKVTIEGFAGTLSSRATFQSLTIADDQGVWLTILNGAISWNRAALLRGQVEIAELSADKILLDRQPVSSGAVNNYEASAPFTLPELPVSVTIGTLRTDALVMAAPVLGQVMTLSINGSANLSGGEGTTLLKMTRTDGTRGELSFTGAFSNQSREATLDLLVAEGPGGIATTLLGLPGQPAAQLAIHGSGPISKFTADLALGTDNQPRLSGKLHLTETQDQGQGFSLSLAGDISPLLQPEYRPFFGKAVVLEAEGSRRPGKRTDLKRLVIDSDGADVTGRLSVSATGNPLSAALTVRLGLPSAEPLRLPLSGDPAFVRAGLVRLRFDTSKGQDWILDGSVDGFSRSGMSLGSLALNGTGKVTPPAEGSRARIGGQIGFDATNIFLPDPALSQALGDRLSGRVDFLWQAGKPLELRQLRADAGDLGISGKLTLSTLGLDLSAKGRLDLRAADMARFSALAGRKLAGAALIRLEGSAQLLTRAFDITMKATAAGLHVDNAMADRMLAQRAEIRLSAARTIGGLSLRSLDLAVASLTAHAEGLLTSQRRDLTGRVDFTDLAVLGPGFGGKLGADIDLSGPIGAGMLALTGTATDLEMGGPLTRPVLQGRTAIAITAREENGGFALTDLHLGNTQASALATRDESGAYQLSAKLTDFRLLVPNFPGPATLEGNLRQTTDGYGLSLSARGPGRASADIRGTIAADLSRLDLALTGNGEAGILNPLLAPRSLAGRVTADLQLQGPPTLTAVEGDVTVSDLRFSSPRESVAITGGNLSARLSHGQATLSGTAALRGGGNLALSGTVGLDSMALSAIRLDLDKARFIAPDSYDTLLSGRVTLDGPLTGGALIGGALVVERAEITVSQSAFSASTIPPIHHKRDSSDSRTTRQRAGLHDPTGQAAQFGTEGPVYKLDLDIDAPARIFVRGLGLDAELSGRIHLRGSTAKVQPQGEFNLIRGRMSVLGKRFALDTGRVELLGSLDPYIDFSASTDTVGATATVTLQGPASKPSLHFSSTEDLPEDEVIAQLLFGTSLENASAFQLVQLGNAIASLTGRGGIDLSDSLRRKLRLDDLDLTVDDEGKVAVKAGKYLSDKLYSEGTVTEEGKATIDMNLNVSTDLRLRGSVGTEGTSGLGLFFGRNY